MTTVLSGTFLVTTEPAPTIEKFPISISGSTVAVAPMDENPQPLLVQLSSCHP